MSHRQYIQTMRECEIPAFIPDLKIPTFIIVFKDPGNYKHRNHGLENSGFSNSFIPLLSLIPFLDSSFLVSKLPITFNISKRMIVEMVEDCLQNFRRSSNRHFVVLSKRTRNFLQVVSSPPLLNKFYRSVNAGVPIN